MNSGTKIAIDEMKSAIKSSGYLLELDVTSELTKTGFVTYMNDTYTDPVTSKTRELDVSAVLYGEIDETELHTISAELIIECENNKQPIVLFKDNSSTSETIIDRTYDIKISGNPLMIDIDDKIMSFNIFSEILENHHYSSIAPCTQYCTFHKPKGNNKDWIALHSDNQHNTLQNLINCLEYKIKHNDNYYYKTQLIEGRINPYVDINMYLPVILINDDLYEAEYEEEKLILNKKEYLQIRVDKIINKNRQTTHIDIITRSFLNKYIDFVKYEVEYLAGKIRDNKRLLEKEANRIFIAYINEFNEKLKKETAGNNP